MKGLNNFCDGVGQNAYHLVWKPKYARDPFKFDLVRKDCEQFLREIAEQYKFEIYELVIEPDHIHMFVETIKNSFEFLCVKNNFCYF